MYELRGASGKSVAEAERIIAALRGGERVGEAGSELESLFRPSVQPFLIALFRYDPTAAVARLEIPVLIVNGSHDLQVGVQEARLLAAAHPAAGPALLEAVGSFLRSRLP
ncbi:MAG: hypothetical protein JW820_04265 [Spirochaetales bacterium]|nr:hypothetical protein [Spirochaetales bacterium]